MSLNGAQAILQMLSEAGVRYLFGNPGTTELPLMDALVDHPSMQYMLGLQEVPVMAMADGYAQASRSIGFVNLHISCGLGNAMGMLYNAYREGTPLLVTAGQQDRRLALEEPILWGDMVSVAKPWSKWATEVIRVGDLPHAIRRGVQAALTPPTGPVFLSIPIDVQAELADGLDLTPPRLPDARVRPPVEAIRRAAEALAIARNPAILVGSRVVESDAVKELVAVAERLGGPVIHESGTTHGRLSFPTDHPLAALGLPLWSPEVRARLNEHDLLLVVGMDLLREYVYHEPPRAIPEHVRIVHIDQDPWQLNKNYPEEVSVIGHLKPSLGELAPLLDQVMTADERKAAQQRGAERGKVHAAAREALIAEMSKQRGLRPLTPLTLMGAIAAALPAHAAVIEEAVTTTGTTLERLGVIKDPTGYFGHRGWALGWGLGMALGVKLAWPERPVLAILGEGASLYGIQGLWTAARYRLPITYVIANNAQYQILKVGAQGMGLPKASAGKFVGLDLNEPEVDLVGVARSFGVDARRVEDPDELTALLRESFAGDRPRLFEVPIYRGTPPRLGYG